MIKRKAKIDLHLVGPIRSEVSPKSMVIYLHTLLDDKVCVQLVLAHLKNVNNLTKIVLAQQPSLEVSATLCDVLGSGRCVGSALPTTTHAVMVQCYFASKNLHQISKHI